MTKSITNRTASIAALACVASVAVSANAAVLMLDTGGTAVAVADRTNSPYHTANPSFTDTTWNTHTQDTTDSTNTWSDGTTATGVTLTNFKGNAGSTSLAPAGWSSGTSSVNGSVVNTGVYAGTSVGRDGFMMTSSFANHRSIGTQVSGLPEGTYDVYITGRNTNYIDAAYTQSFYVASAATAGSFNFGSYASESTSFAASATDKVDAWTFTPGDAAASNYVKLSVTLTAANPYLNIGTIGSGTNGVFNSIQIVAVPEPASLGLFAVIGLIARRRRA